MQINAFHSFTLAIILLFIGKAVTRRYDVFYRYSIPEPVVGGFLCATVVGLLYGLADIRISFDLELRDILLLYFFAGIGLNSDVKTLREGGKPLVILLTLASIFIVLQNVLGMSVATLFGLQAGAGLMTGSVSLIGGVGTTLAWAPEITERLGIANAMEIGMASNMVGLTAACVIGGPVAGYLMRRHGIAPPANKQPDVGVMQKDTEPGLDYYGVLRAWLYLNMALIGGTGIQKGFDWLGLHLPEFVSCLIAGIILRNIVMPLITKKGEQFHWTGIKNGLALISDICLGMFLTMALMGIQLWVLDGVVGFVLVALVLQIGLAILYTVFVVFRFMGKDYEAVVTSAGFGGIALGSTATAVANMTAVTSTYGAAHRSFVVVPLVCGFFIDLVNAFVITMLL